MLGCKSITEPGSSKLPAQPQRSLDRSGAGSPVPPVLSLRDTLRDAGRRWNPEICPPSATYRARRKPLKAAGGWAGRILTSDWALPGRGLGQGESPLGGWTSKSK